MGLLQKAVETYDCHEKRYAGVENTNHNALTPICHTIQKAKIEITIDTNGKALNAISVDEDTIIPATEASAGRSGKDWFKVAHPLCEQLGYLIAEDNYYIPCLEHWEKSEYSHPILTAVLKYVKNGTILTDLTYYGVIKPDDSGQYDISKIGKWLIRWVVVGLSDDEGASACWRNQKLQNAFIQYYRSSANNSNANLCMVTGLMEYITTKHPRGTIKHQSGAKLISANDSSGFTYRGRFREDWQASTVSYLASQKAHNALRWLAAEQGVQAVFGGRTFLCWNPQGEAVPRPVFQLRRPGASPDEVAVQPSDYRKQLKQALSGWQEQFRSNTDSVVLAAFDAATTGRLALTYYSEQIAGDFLRRLHDWDQWCCWENGKFGIQSPSLLQIVNCAFGTQRTELGQTRLKTDDRVLRQQLQRLVSCRVDGGLFPADIEQALVHRASTPQAYDRNVWLSILFTACAAIRKYYHDHKKEDWNMELEPNKKDRSYQFGRLLAVLEKIERDTYDAEESREPNAMRLQSIYVQRPFNTFSTIQLQLKKAYLPRLSPASRTYYERLIGEIVERVSDTASDLNQPLHDTYLLGYYLQKNELYRSKKGKTTDTEEEKA